MVPKIEITDHAVIRYLERIHGIDIETIKKQMQNYLRNHVKPELLEFAGNKNLKIKTTECDFVIRDGKLITVYAKE